MKRRNYGIDLLRIVAMYMIVLYHCLLLGGRILSIVGEASTIEEAHKLVYKYLENYKWNDCFYRHDIGIKAFK